MDIPIINDTEFESLETFLFQISNDQDDPAVQLMPSRSVAAVIILDPEDGVFDLFSQVAKLGGHK